MGWFQTGFYALALYVISGKLLNLSVPTKWGKEHCRYLTGLWKWMS